MAKIERIAENIQEKIYSQRWYIFLYFKANHISICKSIAIDNTEVERIETNNQKWNNNNIVKDAAISFISQLR